MPVSQGPGRWSLTIEEWQVAVDKSIAMPENGTADGVRCHLGRIGGVAGIIISVGGPRARITDWAGCHDCLGGWIARRQGPGARLGGTTLCPMGDRAEPTKGPFMTLASRIPAQRYLPRPRPACDWPTWCHPTGSPTRKCRTGLIFKTRPARPHFPSPVHLHTLLSSVELHLGQAIFTQFRRQDVQGLAAHLRGPQISKD